MTNASQDGAEFEIAMLAIDAEMRAAGVPIPARQIDGARRFAIRHQPGMIIMGKGQSPLSRKVMDWFSTRYGERLSIDPSDGHFVTEIRGDYFRMVPPKFWGMVKFFADKRLEDYDRGGINRPVVYNIIESVRDITKDLSSSLSDEEVLSINRDFFFGLRATSFLAKNKEMDLVDMARGDLATSVDHLVAHPIRAEESKWSSLQAAEKLLKSCISAHGGKFPKTHDLLELSKVLRRLGVGAQLGNHIAKIQCGPGIRYGEEQCTSREAFDAHKAFIMLTMDINRTSKSFKSRLGWTDIPMGWQPP